MIALANGGSRGVPAVEIDRRIVRNHHDAVPDTKQIAIRSAAKT